MVDLSKFKDLYISEADDQIQKLNENLLKLEEELKVGNRDEGQKKFLNELMRASHTLKGSSATMGFENVAYLAHVMEDVFDGARNNIVEISPQTLNVVFDAVDHIEEAIELIRADKKEPELNNVADSIKEITGVNTVGVGKSDRDNIDKKDSENELIKEPKEEDSENYKKNIKAEDANSVTKKIDHIKVPIERLDNLMDFVEELVIDRMRIRELSQKNPELKEISNHIDLLTQSIQYEVMQARLVPVGQIFARFPRMVRDLASKQKKEIEFKVLGGELELDRSVVDKLGEPLVHLLRNAVDHGIENSGDIILQALRQNENAIIIVENSSGKIDLELVKEVAIQKGIVDKEKIQNYNNEQVMNLIFNPRLSTNKEITEISGRGVGLSVVKEFVNSLGGRVLVNNLNPGVRFTMELPLSLAIITALLVKVNKETYAIPFSSIERSIKVHENEIKKMADKEVAVVNETKIPLINLKKIFNFDNSEHGKDALVVVVKKNNELIGFLVDDLVSEQEVTVKPLSPILRQVRGFSGSTILGDGRTILILDINSLLANIKK